MRIWLITIGEPVPVFEGKADRLHRTGYLAHFLAEHHHEVIWWTSTFDHFRKKHVFHEDTKLRINEYLQIRLLHGIGYSSNVSLSRILDHRKIAEKFRKLAELEPRPDIIVSGFPTIELCLAAVRYGEKHKVPVVLDMRDMWPDIFVEAVPKAFQPIAKLLMRPMARAACEACAGARAITGITQAFVDWGLRRGGRIRTVLDRAFPMGYISGAPPADKVSEAEKYWNELGVPSNGKRFVACFFGTIGRQLDLDSVILAARKVLGWGAPVLFVICGIGDRLEHVRRLVADTPNVILPGWVDAARIHVLMRRCSIGLDPLPDRYDFLASINNKAIEYMSAGLPVISSPERGVLHDLLKERRCGMSYPHGNADVLAELILSLCDDRASLQKMSANSMKLFEEMFTAETVYREMMEYLIEIAEGAKKRTEDCAATA